MVNMAEFSIGTDILGIELYSESYKEFCNNLDELTALFDDEMYIEAVSDPRVKRDIGVKKITKRTVETTKDVVGAYGDIVDANGNLIKATWDLFMKSIKLCVKVISWLLNKISLLPKFILRVINDVGQIPDSVKAKIRGDIRLYITVDDIGILYNKSLLLYLEQFFSKVGALSQGDMWGTIFRRRGSTGPSHLAFNKNDMRLIKELTGIYNNIHRINFDKTVINMKDQRSVEMYFGTGKNITYTDLKGNKFSGTYLEALEQLSLVLQAKQKVLKVLQSDLNDKFDRTRMNQALADLHPTDQQRVMNTMRMVTNVIGIIGNITKYIMADVKTINDATQMLIEKGKIKAPEKETPKDDGDKKD